jgi:Flp pilus assembly protein TadG
VKTWGQWVKRQKVRLWQFKKSEGGAAAVEFAMVGLPFFIVLGCICETGLMLFTEYVLQNSVQEAARLVRTGQVSNTDGTITMNANDFKTQVCDQIGIIVNCTKGITVYVTNASTFAALKTAMADPLSIGPSTSGAAYGTVYQPGGQLKAATVVATYDWYFTFPFMHFLGNFNSDKARRLYGMAIFRNEPF